MVERGVWTWVVGLEPKPPAGFDPSEGKARKKQQQQKKTEEALVVQAEENQICLYLPAEPGPELHHLG